DGHCVTHDPGGLSALDPEVEQCHLLISSLQHGGDLPRVDLLEDLRQQLPSLPILYLASAADATAVPEAQLPRDVQVLRSPFTSAELRAAVRRLLPQLGAGTVLARPMVEPTTVTDILELPGGASAPEETNA
ncbi:MAG TPA: hypothetical protein VFD73_03275, partial [Gemmatimonadales bacterium]|nr:hypothetical protein [Gemmatimonadales bacterium]